MSIEAMKQALDALQGSGYYDTTQQREAITALRQAIQESALQRLTDIHQEKEMTAIAESEKQEPVTLEWDEVFDAAAAAYCRSEASRKALRLCFQSREQPTQISIGWTANELMAFAKTISYICTTLPAAQRQWVGLTYEEISASVDICEQNVKGEFLVDYARAIEAKLKEKNT